MMTAITSIESLDPKQRSLYTIVQNRVIGTLKRCYPHHSLTQSKLLSKEEMDGVLPPEIEDMVVNTAKTHLKESFSVNEYVTRSLEAGVMQNIGDELKARGTPQYESTVAILADCIMDFICSEESTSQEKLAKYCKNDAILKSELAELTSALASNSEECRRAQEEYTQMVQKGRMCTTMSCYVGGMIFLCPERIIAIASNLRLPVEEILEVVWTHEEMHSIMHSRLGKEIEEHLAQTMTAAALVKCDKRKQLGSMIELAKNQPREFRLFYESDCRELLAPRARIASGKGYRLRKRRPQMSPFPLDFLPEVKKCIQDVTGGTMVTISKGIARTCNGKYLIGIVLDSKEKSSRVDLTIDHEALSRMPAECSFLILSREIDSSSEAYVIPTSWFNREHSKDLPSKEEIVGIMKLSFTIGQGGSLLDEFKNDFQSLA